MAKKVLHLTHEYESGGGVATVVKNLTEHSSAVMIRLKALLNMSGFEGDEAAIDYSLWLKLMNFIDFKFIDNTVTQFRV